MSAARPRNVLLVMADQLAASWLPAYGRAGVHAPHLSALARDSTVFDAAYCAAPLCAPSRAGLLTGRRPSGVGVYDNAAELPATVPTVTHHLRAAGYRTALSGKMHFVGPDQRHGFEQRLTPDVYPAGIDWTPDWERDMCDPLPWYHTMESVLSPGRYAASMQTDFDDEVAFCAVRHLHDLARSERERPFWLVVSFTNPHDPWEIPSRYWDLYDPDAIELPTTPWAADPHSERLRAMCGGETLRLTPQQIRRARHGYCAAISYLDERVGEVLRALRASGLEDETTVLFTADHGEFLGEHGLWYKMSFRDPSARVPLFARIPGAVPRRVRAPVSLVDLAPTVLELALGAGSAAGAGFDGRPLGGLIEGRAGDGHGPVVCEYHAEGVTAPAAMIRDGAHKLVVCATDPDQLFDLAADPYELHDLAQAPDQAGRVAALRSELDQRLDLAGLDARVRASQRERQLIAHALAQGAPAEWDYAPAAHARMRYVRERSDLYNLARDSRLPDRD